MSGGDLLVLGEGQDQRHAWIPGNISPARRPTGPEERRVGEEREPRVVTLTQHHEYGTRPVRPSVPQQSIVEHERTIRADDVDLNLLEDSRSVSTTGYSFQNEGVGDHLRWRKIRILSESAA